MKQLLWRSFALFALIVQAIALRSLASEYARIRDNTDVMAVTLATLLSQQQREGVTSVQPRRSDDPLPSVGKLKDFSENVGGSVVVQ